MNSNYQEYYDLYGDIYFHKRQKEGGMLFNEAIEIPAILKLLESKEVPVSARALDIGCAFGFYSKYLADKGYFVVALDISKTMIDTAKEYCGERPNISFINKDFFDVEFGTQLFHVILGSFMLGYFSDLDNLFRKVKSIADKNAVILFSMLHPIVQSKLDRTERGYIISDYFDTSFFESDFLTKGQILNLKKWSIPQIFEACKKNGLYIDLLIEPKIEEVKVPEFENGHFYLRNPSIVIFCIRTLN